MTSTFTVAEGLAPCGSGQPDRTARECGFAIVVRDREVAGAPAAPRGPGSWQDTATAELPQGAAEAEARRSREEANPEAWKKGVPSPSVLRASTGAASTSSDHQEAASSTRLQNGHQRVLRRSAEPEAIATTRPGGDQRGQHKQLATSLRVQNSTANLYLNPRSRRHRIRPDGYLRADGRDGQDPSCRRAHAGATCCPVEDRCWQSHQTE